MPTVSSERRTRRLISAYQSALTGNEDAWPWHMPAAKHHAAKRRTNDLPLRCDRGDAKQDSRSLRSGKQYFSTSCSRCADEIARRVFQKGLQPHGVWL